MRPFWDWISARLYDVGDFFHRMGRGAHNRANRARN
jgi:hypothetical protein